MDKLMKAATEADTGLSELKNNMDESLNINEDSMAVDTSDLSYVNTGNLKHYSGDLGEFDYDLNQFTIWKNLNDDCCISITDDYLYDLNKRCRESKEHTIHIVLPKGIKKIDGLFAGLCIRYQVILENMENVISARNIFAGSVFLGEVNLCSDFSWLLTGQINIECAFSRAIFKSKVRIDNSGSCFIYGSNIFEQTVFANDLSLYWQELSNCKDCFKDAIVKGFLSLRCSLEQDTLGQFAYIGDYDSREIPGLIVLSKYQAKLLQKHLKDVLAEMHIYL